MFALIKNLFAKASSGGILGSVASQAAQNVIVATDYVKILKEAYAEYGGEWDPEINIFGIRNKDNPLGDSFDDIIGVCYVDPMSGEEIIRTYRGTTDPGLKAIRTQTNIGGASHMALGFQKDIWVLGAHKGPKHADGYQFIVDPALIALGGAQRVWKDKNGDGKRQADETEQLIWDSLNCHCASPYYTGKDSEKILTYSYGCQVIQSRRDWDEFIGIVTRSNKGKTKKSKFSYMLFDKSQIVL
jgi:hypothetical protein